MTLVVRAFAMCLAAGIVFCASAGMARSAPLRERAGPPVPHGEAGQVVLWQGEEVSIGPKGAADPNYRISSWREWSRERSVCSGARGVTHITSSAPNAERRGCRRGCGRAYQDKSAAPRLRLSPGAAPRVPSPSRMTSPPLRARSK